MPEDPEKSGELYIPGEYAQKTRADIGRAIATGRADVPLGSLVLSRPYTGVWVVNPSWIEGAHEVHCHPANCDGVLAVIENPRLRFLNDEVLICRKEKPKELSGLMLAGDAQRWSGIAKILEVGAKVDDPDIRAGVTLLAWESDGTMLPFTGADEIAEWYGVEPHTLRIIKAENCLAVQAE